MSRAAANRAHHWLHCVSVQPEFPLSPRQYSSANASQVRGTCWPGVDAAMNHEAMLPRFPRRPLQLVCIQKPLSPSACHNQVSSGWMQYSDASAHTPPRWAILPPRHVELVVA